MGVFEGCAGEVRAVGDAEGKIVGGRTSTPSPRRGHRASPRSPEGGSRGKCEAGAALISP